MNDLSQFSDAELEAIAHQESDLSQFSDEQLEAIAGSGKHEEHKEQPSLGRSLKRGLKNIALGGADLLDLGHAPLNALRGLVGMPQRTSIAEDIEKIGPQAQNDSEKVSNAVQRGLATLPIGMGLGHIKNLGTAGKFLKTISAPTASNIAGTVGSSAAMQHSLNTMPDNPTAALLAGIGGGSLASGLSGMKRAPGRVAEALKINPSKVEAFQNAGVAPLMGDVSDSKILKGAQHSLEYLPGSSDKLSQARANQLESMGEILGQGDFTHRQGSETAIKGVRAVQKANNQKFQKGFSQIESDISKMPDQNIHLKNFVNAWNKETKHFSKHPQMWEEFKKTEYGKQFLDIVKNGDQQSYFPLKQKLSALNNKVKSFGQIGGIDQGKLKYIGKALERDIDASLTPKFKQLGPDAYHNWKSNRALYHAYAENEIPHLNEMFKGDKKNAVSAFTKLQHDLKTGGKKAELALSGLNEKDRHSLIQGIHQELGSRSDNSFSLAQWRTRFKGLEPEVKNILLSPINKSNKKQIESLADAMTHVKSTLDEANTSKTAYYATLAKIGSGFSAATASAVTGNILPAAGLAVGLLTTKLGAAALTNQKLINGLSKAMKARNLETFQQNLHNISKFKGLPAASVRTIKQFQHELYNPYEETR